MSQIDLACGRMFRLTFWSEDDLYGDPSELRLLHEDPAVRARFGDRPLRHIGMVNGMPLWVEDADAEGAVFCRWMLGGEYELDQVADRRANLASIAELVELLWGPHQESFSLPYDDAHRSTARDVLGEIARANPGSKIEFWRYSFFRQYDIHIYV